MRKAARQYLDENPQPQEVVTSEPMDEWARDKATKALAASTWRNTLGDCRLPPSLIVDDEMMELVGGGADDAVFFNHY